MSPIVRLSGTQGATGTFQVGSRTRAGARYRVEVTSERVLCSCPGYAYRHGCWHVRAVDAAVRAELVAKAAARLEEIAMEFGL